MIRNVIAFLFLALTVLLYRSEKRSVKIVDKPCSPQEQFAAVGW